MILADHATWHTWGELTVWLAAVAAAIGLLTRTRPVRWMWRRLVSGPITEWFRATGGEIIEEKVGKEFASNGGASLRDAIDGLKGGQETIADRVSETATGQDALVAQVGEVQTAVVAISASVGTTLADHGQRLTAVEDGQKDVLEAIDRLHRCMERRLAGTAGTASDRRAYDDLEESA